MKKISIICFIFFCMYIYPVYGMQPNDILELRYNHKKVGELTVAQLQELVETTEWATQIKKAQQNKNTYLKITVLSLVPVTNKIFKIIFRIDWLNDKKKSINYIVVESIITITPDTLLQYSNIRILYRDVSEIATPILFLLCILFAII